MRFNLFFLTIAIFLSSFFITQPATAYELELALYGRDNSPCTLSTPAHPFLYLTYTSPAEVGLQIINEKPTPASTYTWNSLYRNNILIQKYDPRLHVFWSTTRTDQDPNLRPNTTYEYKLGVLDYLGRLLLQSAPLSVTTQGAGILQNPSPPTATVDVGATGRPYSFYTTVYPDPDGLQVKVIFDWNDILFDMNGNPLSDERDTTSQNDEGCITPAPGGTKVWASHKWTRVGQYEVKVAAINSQGKWSTLPDGRRRYAPSTSMNISSSNDWTPPTAPTNPSVSTISGASQALLTWSPATDDTAVYGYRIFRNGQFLTYSKGTYFYDVELLPATMYTYEVDAYDGAGNVSLQKSNPVSVIIPNNGTIINPPLTVVDDIPPTKPTNLSATAVSSSQINLSWTASTDNVAVTGYTIFRDGSKIGTTANTTYPDMGLTASTAYSYTVSAYDAAENPSEKSNSVSATTKSLAGKVQDLTPPLGLTAQAVSSSQINLSWRTPANPIDLRAYRIYFSDGSFIDAATGLSYSVTGLLPNTEYSFTVASYGNSGFESVKSNLASATTLPAQATLPATLTVSSVPSGASVMNSNTGYIYCSATPCSVKVATPGSINIKISKSGYSDWTSSATLYAGQITNVNATLIATPTSFLDLVPPTTPTNPSATPVSTSQINLAWNASTDNVGVAGYQVFKIEYKPNRSSQVIATTSATYYYHTGLSENTAYSYAVGAFDFTGNVSPQSNSVSTTTFSTSKGPVTDTKQDPKVDVTPSASCSVVARAVIKVLGGCSEINESEYGAIYGKCCSVTATPTLKLIPPSSSNKFTRNLKLGSSGDDVSALQKILASGKMYPEGSITGYFGQKTKMAVIRFQEKYASEILTPAGLDKGNGIVGAGTRVKLNMLYNALLKSGKAF